MKKMIFLSVVAILLVNREVLPQTSFENAIDFDGNGDYANTFNSPYFPTDNGTLEAWVKVRSIILPENIQSIGEAFVAKNEEQWNIGDFYVYFEYATGLLKSRIQAPPTVQVDVRSNNNFWQYFDIWFHYAFTWGSDGMKMYLNGELQSNQNNLTYSALNNTYNFYVGAHDYMLHNGSYVLADFFDGQIDELRIWNYQKSSEGILELWDAPLDSSYFITIDSGLVGYWRFDELEDLGINNDGVDDVRDFSVLQNHLDLAGDAHLVGSNIVIPVELVSFTAVVDGNLVNLNWSTATETNNMGFRINRDGDEVGFIPGAGTTTEPRNYSFTDENIENGTYLYSLIQVDYDGTTENVGAVEIVINKTPNEYSLLQNFPNPFNPSTIISFTILERTKVVLIVYDVLGTEIAELINDIKSPGRYEVEFNSKGLPSGIYLYTIQAGKFTNSKKMILLK